ncbi:hypothetical protein [Microbacterium sp.]|uniref:hypothetical protein n=1 Tax=Microbacterium sp. TaxID=51671 RepID=UPI00333F170B
MDDPLAALAPDATHRDAAELLRSAGWTDCGAGDWAFALRSPDGDVVARISPFDPTGPYAARLYRDAAGTRQVPELHAHLRLAGGGDLQLMERLTAVDEGDAAAFHGMLVGGEPELRELAGIVNRIHAQAIRELPWCGPLDTNPSNVMRGADGRLVLTDPYFADGPALYSLAGTDPDAFAARLPEPERRYLTEIPLTWSGPWSDEDRKAMRAGIAEADRRREA